ncbi:kinase-like protein [Melanomma pulvis-pyrius CBS 109.77]|uniref:Kinase-like protein n=1 Tax=Melanomma pulvis-pyrius CBS 109.77 TaxID=1314802 RepID=A0A6A6XWS4_9PLEO|nr:kinase-like protein [Melanomma pulvis-pyrius CBS 109.77]
MASYSLPYYANPTTIPAQLPTIEEIGAAQGILSDKLATKVVAIGDHFVVKYGPQVDLLEGETMLFLQNCLSVPVPRIYALFWSPNNKIKFIVMERIKGQDLSLIWAKLDHAAKETLAIKLRSIFTELRQLTSPGGYCSVGHRGLLDGIFWTNDASHPFAGPFKTESDLNKAMVAKYVEDGLSKHKAEYYTRTFKEVLQNHPPVFTHADFQRKNVIIRTSSKSPTDQVGEQPYPELEIVIIDWEFGGWYPSYWEYARTIFACGGWEDDWSLWVDSILEPFRNEYVWTNMFLLELWS